MDLLTLNLHAPLVWNRNEAALADIHSAPDALTVAEKAAESAEIAMVWDWDAVVESMGDDGPFAKRPLPRPARVASAGLLPATLDGKAPLAPPSNAQERLEAGRYLFAQTRRPADQSVSATGDWLADSLDWFVREAWWTGAKTQGPLVIRLVHEDGKTAVQLIRRLAAQA